MLTRASGLNSGAFVIFSNKLGRQLERTDLEASPLHSFG
ncbi:hypothetical protein GGGNBK_07130 [Sporosarcina sp. ANT_H38]